MKNVHYLLVLLLITACGGSEKKTGVPGKAKNDSTVVINPADQIPLYRDTIQEEPVQQYQVPVGDGLNDWYFSVKLYETSRTFHYLIRLQYEEIRGTDTLKLPNFGMLPKPVIKPGTDKHSCIIGFMDKEDQFREYKKVYVQNNQLKITALKHYAVATYKTEIDPGAGSGQ